MSKLDAFKFEDNLIKEEWIDGAIMMSPRPQYNHMEIMEVLGEKLRSYFGDKCKVRTEGALFLTKENPAELKKDLSRLKELITSKKAEVVPDIAVYCDKEQRFRRGFLGIPQLVVEVLSPSNSFDDTVKKKDLYESYGIPEYWIADPMTKKVHIFNLNNGRYTLDGEFNFLEEEIKSVKFEDLTIDIKDIDLIEDDDFDF